MKLEEASLTVELLKCTEAFTGAMQKIHKGITEP
jgi:hypothetical protein